MSLWTSQRSSKYLFFVAENRKSHRFAMTQGCVKDHRIFLFWMNYPFRDGTFGSRRVFENDHFANPFYDAEIKLIIYDIVIFSVFILEK